MPTVRTNPLARLARSSPLALAAGCAIILPETRIPCLYGQDARLSTKHDGEVIKLAKDPVCGMMVDEKKAPAKSEYKGQTYYFCAKGCKVAFDKDPEKYLAAHPGEKKGH